MKKIVKYILDIPGYILEGTALDINQKLQTDYNVNFI